MNTKTLSAIVIGLLIAGPFLGKVAKLDDINFISVFYYALLIIFGGLMLRNFKPRSGLFWVYLGGLLVFAAGLIFYYLF
jgi:hypothetical protein